MGKLAIGLMSGTSLDGIDVALIQTEQQTICGFGPSLTIPYDAEQRQRIRSVFGGIGPVAEVEAELTHAHAHAVQQLLAQAGLTAAQVDVIGFHGQTILHQPDQRRTWQIGDGALLARLTGIAVVNDFRSADVAAGGQGAPLVPVYHRALAADLPKPVAVVNLGGVGNITWIGQDGALLAFDTGPGNALLDDWLLARLGESCDRDGRFSAMGQVDQAALDQFLALPYFTQKPPKSLDRDQFRAVLDRLGPDLRAEDGAATLAAMTVASVVAARQWCPQSPRQWLICGGGRHNPTIMSGLNRQLSVPVHPVEQVGWDGDGLEAQAFAYLAVLHQLGLPQTFPETTGCPAPMGGGQLHLP